MANVIGSQIPQTLPDVSRGSGDRAGNSASFGDAFTSAIKQIDTLQGEADTQVTNLLAGNGQDLHSAMIAVQKADISFQLMMQVRNKIVNAYQEIARMQF